MVLRLNMADSSFEKSFSEYASKSRESGADVRPDVAAIIDKVRGEGFGALAELTEKYDGHSISKETARVSLESCREGFESLDKDLQGALRHSADRIRAFHERQIPDDFREVDSVGIEAGWRWTPVDAAGLYAPGGRAAYPSSVLMNAIPAKVAGVERLVLVTPTPGGTVNQTVLAAAFVAGVDEVWVVGGAQAIAALAFGADPIEPVDVIVGPGNAFVAEAKRQVFGHVGVDSVAGPSEVVVIADADNDPDWIAADLLSQAEHDPSSQAVLFTPDDELADAVAAAATKQLEDHPRRDITTAAWQNNSAIVVTHDLKAAASLSNRLAPEHLEIA
ncbi:MAG: histidinol dehydrogenase, partial [Pseudomonadota bacterium]